MLQKLSNVVTVLIVLSLSNVALANHWLFVSLLQEKKILTFERDIQTGMLTRQNETLCPAEPAFLSSSADGKTLFVSLRSTGQLASYQISADNGQLQLISIVEGGADPAYLQTDNTGNYLLTAYYAANKVTVHRILEDGSLSGQPVQAVVTAEKAHGIAFTADNKTVLVSHTGANRIYSFHFEEETGKLLNNQPEFLTTPVTHEPRHIMVHPSDNWAYSGNEKGDSISRYDLNNGQLLLRQTLSTIPTDFDGTTNSTSRCEITQNGQFIYVANRGHDSIAAFKIDQTSGKLTSLGQTPTEAIPRSFSICPSGKFLYVAGEKSGRIAAYRIDAGGCLNSIAAIPSGPVSWSVVAVDSN